MLSMFYRVSNAVIAPNLVRELGLNAETLGLLGGAYFYSFSLLQIPMGLMLDRIGPRFVITLFPLIGGLGAFVFASGNSLTLAFIGRILIGAGMASVLMGSFKVFTLRFPPEMFATLVGILLSIGTLGNILAASPLAYLASTIGWRTAFVVAGGITTVLAFVAFWVLGGEGGRGRVPLSSSDPDRSIGQTIRLLVRSLAFWQMGAVAFFRYGTFMSLQGLWLGPYLMEIKGYSPIQAGNLLIMLAVGAIAGGPLGGRLSDRAFRSRKRVALAGFTLYGLSLFPLIGIWTIESRFWFSVVFFFIGFFYGFAMVIYSHAKALFPLAISGTAMAGVNFFTMAGVAVFMPALGWMIESFHRTGNRYPAEAYHLCFLICFLGMAASLVFYAFSKAEKPSPELQVRSSESPD